jgi:hypothetical protein
MSMFIRVRVGVTTHSRKKSKKSSNRYPIDLSGHLLVVVDTPSLVQTPKREYLHPSFFNRFSSSSAPSPPIGGANASISQLTNHAQYQQQQFPFHTNTTHKVSISSKEQTALLPRKPPLYNPSAVPPPSKKTSHE